MATPEEIKNKLLSYLEYLELLDPHFDAGRELTDAEKSLYGRLSEIATKHTIHFTTPTMRTSRIRDEYENIWASTNPDAQPMYQFFPVEAWEKVREAAKDMAKTITVDMRNNGKISEPVQEQIMMMARRTGKQHRTRMFMDYCLSDMKDLMDKPLVQQPGKGYKTMFNFPKKVRISLEQKADMDRLERIAMSHRGDGGFADVVMNVDTRPRSERRGHKPKKQLKGQDYLALRGKF